MLQAFRRPSAYLEQKTNYYGYRLQFVFVVLAGFAMGLDHFLMRWVWSEDIALEITGVVWVLPVMNLLYALIIWGGATVAILFVSKVLVDSYSSATLFRRVGFGVIPLIIAGLAQSAGRLIAVLDFDDPEEPALTGFEHEMRVYEPWLEQATTEPLFIVGTIIAIPFVLFAGYMWYLAIREVSNADQRDGAILAAIPTLLALIWLLPGFL